MLTAARALRAWNALFGECRETTARAGAISGRVAGVQPAPDALAVLGHELRTPLAALMGYTEMLAGAGQLTEAQSRAWSASAYAAASHLNALVTSVLESGVEGLGAPSSNREIVDAGALVAGCCDFVRPDASARGVNLYSPAPGSGPELHCDPRAVRQIVLNLLANAIKFTPPGGDVRLEAKLEDGMVALTVTDTGIGLDEAGRRQAAARQASAGAEAAGLEPTGLGIGLLLVRSLASLHGGEVQIHAGESAGTVARVALPSGAVAPASETSAGSTRASHMMVPCLA
ncbi:sensor histidine kinase [Camelimonas sp. ID_303_24]